VNSRLYWILAVIGLLIVTGVGAQEQQPLYALPTEDAPVFTSGSMALSREGTLLATANMLNDTLSIVAPRDAERLAEIAVGDDPRSVALTPDASRAFVVNRGDGTLSIVNTVNREVISTVPVGVLPYAVITDNATTAYISVQGTDEIIEIDQNTGEILTRIPVPADPAGLALWGDFLYVTHFWTGELSLIYRPQNTLVRTISTGVDTALFQSLAINPNNGIAYLPQTRSNAQNPAITFDTLSFPVVNRVDLSDMSLLRQRRIAVDVADRAVHMPFSVAIDPVRRLLFVVNAGSNDLAVIDLASGLALTHINVNANPRTIRLSRDLSLLYVHNVIDGTVSIIETREFRTEDVVLVSDLQVSIDVLLGAQLFHAADNPQLTRSNRISCAACHFDGQSDGRIWQGLPDGPRNTPVLYGLAETAPYNWSGTWDEVADVELKIRGLQAGRGLIDGPTNTALGDLHAGLSVDLDTLADYVVNLPPPRTPAIDDTSLINRGETVFLEQGCATCHAGTSGTDGLAYDVGTGGTFDTPTLNWLWQSAPYYHDGRAATLQDVFMLEGTHRIVGEVSPADLDALIAYLNSRP